MVSNHVEYPKNYFCYLSGADCIRSQHFDRALIIAVAQAHGGQAVKNPIWPLWGALEDPEIISILQ
jgi:hypothetical protein